MVKNYLLKSGIIAALATITNAQSLFTPIDFDSTLELYYYFRNGNAIASITEDGINIEGSFSSNDELCTALNGAQLVYSSDDGADVLLTSDCYSVYHLVDNSSSEITWSSCQEFSFYPSYCPEDSASVSTTLSSTATAQNTVSGTETLYLTTVTTTLNNIETIYTTYCPLSEITASQPEATGAGATTNIAAVPVQTSTYVATISGSVGTFTTLIPLTGSASGIADADAGKTYVTNTDYYDSFSQAASTSVSGSETYVLTTVTSSIGADVTIYTTYCPLSDVSTGTAAETSAPTEAATGTTVAATGSAATTGSAAATGTTEVTATEGTAAVETQVYSTVVTDNGEVSTITVETLYTISESTTGAASATEASTTVEQVGASSSSAETATAAVSQFEGGAARLINSVSFASFVAIVLGFFC